jgi:DNA polymerase
VAILHLDLETRSVCDLAKCGLHVYAQHETTGIWCGAYAFDDEEPEIWLEGQPVPPRVYVHIAKGGEVWAHNAAFERILINAVGVRHGWPTLSIAQMRCTMAMCYAMGLPGALGRAAAALNLPERKDSAGRETMVMLAAPLRSEPLVWYTPERYPKEHAEMRAYCIQDVVVERALGKRCMPLSDNEQRVWQLDQEINDRGMGIDRRGVAVALALVKKEETRLNAQLSIATGGMVNGVNCNAALAAWMRANGVDTKSMAKDRVTAMLEKPDLAPAARQVLLIRQEAGKASVKKLLPMLLGANRDGRLRGAMQYHGAFTGRWAGRRVQPHNLPRPALDYATIEWLLEEPETRLTSAVTGLFDRPMNVISDALRSFIVAAPGHELVSADLSQIEARVLPWLAGEEKVLDIFRGDGRVYEAAAAEIYHVPLDSVTKTQRQIGKVAVLALGYGGGKGSFITMGKAYGVKVSKTEAENIKLAWRAAHPNITRYWRLLDEAAIGAVRNPGARFWAGPVAFRKAGSFLLCKLPSSRVIVYPYPRVELIPEKVIDEDTTIPEHEGLTYQVVHEEGGHWARDETYGGKLAENVTQATARCVLSDAMLRIRDAGYDIVLHVHDEAVAEVPVGQGNVVELLNALMATPPPWAAGLPIASEGWSGPRYRK